jgi:hypothetical protein
MHTQPFSVFLNNHSVPRRAQCYFSHTCRRFGQLLTGRVVRSGKALLVVLAVSVGLRLPAVVPGPPGGGGGNAALASFSFSNTNWEDSAGYAPVGFTNLENIAAGDGTCLELDSTNAAFLHYNVVETSGVTNLTVNVGSVTFWLSPDWSSVSKGGAGPGGTARLLEIGSSTTNASYGLWSLWIDSAGSNVWFSAQNNSGQGLYYLAAPIAFQSNIWYFFALTYSSSNTCLYIDGAAITNGPGVSVFPNQAVLAKGFWVGSASNGAPSTQMHAKMDDLSTYSYPLNATAISGTYGVYGIVYYGSLLSEFFSAAPFVPAVLPAGVGFEAVTGAGYLTPIGTNYANCVTSGKIWITNVAAEEINGSISLTFSVAGGSNGVPYDVFATGVLTSPITNADWAWIGQAYQCVTNQITGITNPTCFLILGTPQDTDNDGLTDAYELLVSHTNPSQSDTFGGLPDAWLVMNGLLGATNIDNLDPDLDGLSNQQEYLYGTKPLQSEGMAVWVNTSGWVNGIP